MIIEHFLYDVKRLNNGKTLLSEVLCALLALGVLIAYLRPLLLDGQGIMPHDNLYWGYPIFHFFAENLVHGHFPLWDPFMHGGEPFYPLLAQIRLLEPLPLLVIGVASRFSKDTMLWFNWFRFVQALVLVSGVYLLYRPLARRLWIRLTLLPILLFSSFLLGSFPQDGIVSGFLWVPYQAIFLLRLLYRKGNAWANWLALAVLVGWNWQSYHFAATWLFLLFGTLGVGLFRRRLLLRLVRGPRFRAQLAVFLLVVGLMALPDLALYLDSGRFVFPLRMAPADFARRPPNGGPVQVEGLEDFVSFGTRMPYAFGLFTGGSSQIWDFVQMVSPEANANIHKDLNGAWGFPSESYLYLGLLPWAVGLFGLFFARQAWKPVMIFLTMVFALLMLGPRGGVHAWLFPIYPPLWFIRNTGMLAPFFELGVVYFYLIGLERIFAERGPS